MTAVKVEETVQSGTTEESQEVEPVGDEHTDEYGEPADFVEPSPGRIVLLNIGVVEPILRPALVIDAWQSDPQGPADMVECHPYFSAIADFPLAAGLKQVMAPRMRDQSRPLVGAQDTVVAPHGDAFGAWRWPVRS